MRRNKLNRVVFLMLAAGILLTFAVNGAVAGARKRRAGEQHGPAEIAEASAGSLSVISVFTKPGETDTTRSAFSAAYL